MSRCLDPRSLDPGVRCLLLGICLLCASALTGCGSGVTPEQKQAIAKFQDLGGKVNFKRGGYEVDLKGTQVEDEDLEYLKHIPNLKNVDLQGTLVDDDALVHLQGLTTLEIITLQRTGISRDGIEKLRKSLPNTDVQR